MRAEQERLAALTAYEILDTDPEAAFDRITLLAADLFDAPISLISLVDAERQWFKSRQGLEAESTPRSMAFCAHALGLGPNADMVVGDASQDPRFAANPLVTGDPNIRFYAGAVLTSPEGHNLGTLCVIDTKPRPAPTPAELKRLNVLARVVVNELELRRSVRVIREKQQLLDMAERLSSVGQWRLEVATGHVTWSDEVYRIHGFSRETFEPNLARGVSFYHGDDEAKIRDLIGIALATQQGFDCELKIDRADGAVRDVACKAQCLLDDRGEVSVLFGVLQDVTEEKAIRAKLERSRTSYRLLAENAADVITRIAFDGNDGFISPAIETLLGYRPDEMAVLPPLEFITPADRPIAAQALSDMRNGAQYRTIQYRAVHKDGRLIWVETRMRAVQDAAGKTTGVVAVIRDIADRKALEFAMADSEAKYRILADSSSDIILKCGRDGLIRYISPACRRLGFDPDTAIGKPIVQFVAPDSAAHTASIIEALFETAEIDPKVRRLHKLVDKDGRDIWMEGSPSLIRDKLGQVVEVMTVLRDVTARREIELALETSEQRYHRLADNAPDLINEASLDGMMTYASPASLAITGYRPEELVGRSSSSLVNPEDAQAIRAMCETVLASKGKIQPWPVEFRAFHKAGHEIWLECRPTPVRDPVTGRYTGFTDIIRDITARKTLETELRAAREEAEASARVKSEFLANMSHELRTPLTSITGFTRLAAAQSDLTPLTRTYVERVGDASQALLCTVNDILDFSKLESGQVSITPQPISPSQLSRATLELFAPQAGAKDLDLCFDAAPDLDELVIAADPDRIRQILLNLVGNAVKFTDLGAVTLRMIYDSAAERLRVEVIDTGAGIDPEKQSILFKRFSQVDGTLTRTHGGTGLGLAICKGLVEAMGGQIGLRSRVGEGSCFWFEVPAKACTNGSASTADGGRGTLSCSGLRVLVVDDHRANRELARLFLTGVGAEVTEAENGEDAVRMANEMPFDVVLMDLRMPRLDGHEAAAQIWRGGGVNDLTPILAFTADAEYGLETELIAEGFAGVVAKPVEPGVLIKAVAQAAAFDSPSVDLASAVS